MWTREKALSLFVQTDLRDGFRIQQNLVYRFASRYKHLSTTIYPSSVRCGKAVRLQKYNNCSLAIYDGYKVVLLHERSSAVALHTQTHHLTHTERRPCEIVSSLSSALALCCRAYMCNLCEDCQIRSCLFVLDRTSVDFFMPCS